MTDQEVSEIRRLEHQMMVANQRLQETANKAAADAERAVHGSEELRQKASSVLSVAKWIITVFGVSGISVVVFSLTWAVTTHNRLASLELTDEQRRTHETRITRLETTGEEIMRSLGRIESKLDGRSTSREPRTERQ